MKTHIIMSGKIHPRIIEMLQDDCELHQLPADPAQRGGFPAETISRISVLLSGAGGPAVDKAIIDSFPALKLIANFGVGYDHIDALYAASKGVIVTNTPDVLTDEVADLAIGLTLSVIRQLPQADRFLREGKWDEGLKFPFSYSLRGRKVGIVGLGRIGSAIAHRFSAFDCEVAYFSRSAKPGISYRYCSTIKELAETCDLLVVATSGGAETRHLINADILKALGKEGILINIARGSVIDEDALITALQNKVIASAGLDVFTNEPHVPQALKDMEHVVLLPHIGSASAKTRNEMAELVANNVLTWLQTGKVLTSTPETKALA